jgi:ribose 5-phosphate isomerase B
MIIALGADHRGCEVSQELAVKLEKAGHDVRIPVELTSESTDYPDYAAAVGKLVASGDAERGVLVCGSGIGMSIAANKIKGVRAALVHDELSARMSRAHNDANVVCVSADLLSAPDVLQIVRTWLEEDFEGGRHQRRVDKITAIEREACAQAT